MSKAMRLIEAYLDGRKTTLIARAEALLTRLGAYSTNGLGIGEFEAGTPGMRAAKRAVAALKRQGFPEAVAFRNSAYRPDVWFVDAGVM